MICFSGKNWTASLLLLHLLAGANLVQAALPIPSADPQKAVIEQQIEALQVAPSPQMPEVYQNLAREARKLSVTFRFKEGSAALDSKAQQDLLRLTDYLKRNDKLQTQVSLVGFGDTQEDPDRVALFSKLRAMTVRRELVKAGVSFRLITGLGGILPVAANSSASGRMENRRVEVWVY